MAKEFLHQELEVAHAGADIKETSGWRRAGKIFASAVFAFSIILTISAVVFTVIFFISEVDGPSMMLTLNPTYKEDKNAMDHVLVNRYITPKPGDIIVVEHYWEEWQPRYKELPDNNKMDYFIKRLIATEGQRVRFEEREDDIGKHYVTIVDDYEIEESYLDKDWGRMTAYGTRIHNYMENISNDINQLVPFRDRCVFENKNPESSGFGKWEIVVPQGEVFFMGDNRCSSSGISYSYDCTSFGPQPASYIEGVSVDTIKSTVSIPQYVWIKVKEFFSFKWLFG